MKQNCWLKKGEREREKRKRRDRSHFTGKICRLGPLPRISTPFAFHDAINALNSDEFATNWEDLWKLFTALLEIVRRMEFSCNSLLVRVHAFSRRGVYSCVNPFLPPLEARTRLRYFIFPGEASSSTENGI